MLFDVFPYSAETLAGTELWEDLDWVTAGEATAGGSVDVCGSVV